MHRQICLAGMVLLAGLSTAWFGASNAEAAKPGQPTDWQRFYHYPYVYYPHTFQQPIEYDHMYYKYPMERRIPVYNKGWYNPMIEGRPYYSGHHFILDQL
ncbi:hypothetical protein Pla110_39270 [Polystyrenella longa]|uniref:Uncharacterized protein n=1 Tax=Polystyrenella longa TaxID=2528007 RepID=A0A518CSG5_9PLAN|nr:hypothetical protein [Polystyrenella longa]QDU82172.1 hypothetical protein Pla110_39270 [Polystyrenella longa]